MRSKSSLRLCKIRGETCPEILIMCSRKFPKSQSSSLGLWGTESMSWCLCSLIVEGTGFSLPGGVVVKDIYKNKTKHPILLLLLLHVCVNVATK